MTLTISRLSGMADHTKFAMNGGRLSLGSIIYGSTEAEAQALRNSLATLGEQPTIEPIYSTTDTAMNGMWRIDSASVSAEIGMWGIHHGFELQLSATRVSHGWQTPIVTGRSVGRERTGAGGVSEDYWCGFPSSVHGFDLTGDTAQYYTRTGPGGDVRMHVDASLANNVFEYSVNPDDYYDMAPTFKVDGYTVLGCQPLTIGNTDDWELSNGFLRIRGASASTHTLRMAGPTPSSVATPPVVYGTDKSFILGGYLSGVREILRPSIVQCLLNTPELVIIRLIGYIQTDALTDNYKLAADIALRRGGSFVECVMSAKLAIQCSVKDLAASSLTIVTAAKTVRSTADDGDSNGIWIASGTALNTGSVASGEVYANVAATQFPFALGFALDGSTAAAPNIYADQFDHYWADQTITLEVGA